MFQRSFPRNGRGKWQGNSNRARRGVVRGAGLTASRYINKATPGDAVENYTILHNFSDFNLDERIKNNIKLRGYEKPTPIQDQIISHLLEGRDVVGIANTGTGKTAAFLLPIINKIIHDRAQKVLIIVPTRELAAQIEEELRYFSRSLNVSSLLCIGGASINRQIYFLRQNPNVIIGTPGRLKDLINQRFLQMQQFKTVVLDEVDRMVDIGFIKDIRHIISLLPRERQSLFFSATVSNEVGQIIQSFASSPITISVKTKETAQNIEQDIIKVNSKEEKIQKLDYLLRQEEFKKVIVFGRTKWNVERLACFLQERGFLAGSIHGNKSQGQRQRTLSQFKQNQLQILVATDIAARGLDISDVSHVINFDEPNTYDDYVHRIGRTGRANKQGKALTFVS